MKISVLMPTYNDGPNILNSIASMQRQLYKNWELIIVDDGSKDNTRELVEGLNEERIRYIYQENKDQLNALLNGSDYISGDAVCMLHSDDTFDEDVLSTFALALEENENIDGIYGNMQLFGGKDEIDSLKNIALSPFNQLVQYTCLGGGNILTDPFFVRRKVFEDFVLEGYIKWNVNYWIDWQRASALNLMYINKSLYNYRVQENTNRYLTNDIGMLNRINGNIRIVSRLSEHYYIPALGLQRFVVLLLNKFGLYKHFSFLPLHFRRETPMRERYLLFKYLFKKRYKKKGNIYIEALLDFYKNYNNRLVCWEGDIKLEDLFYGKDMRTFNTLLMQDALPPIYYFIFKEAKTGFSLISTKRAEDKEKLELISSFLSLKFEHVLAL